ncbi:MAG TPA: hypothetical protein DCF78_10360 [Dehalococcoidia bacterium]|nr:hypothetical protein [Dehalococcoidia bacterium]
MGDGAQVLFSPGDASYLAAVQSWKIIRLRREMAEFAAARGRNLIIGDRAVREVTLAWVEDHPQEFVLGEYDPAVPKLQSASKKSMDRRR